MKHSTFKIIRRVQNSIYKGAFSILEESDSVAKYSFTKTGFYKSEMNSRSTGMHVKMSPNTADKLHYHLVAT